MKIQTGIYASWLTLVALSIALPCSADIDAPHNAVNIINCASCHDSSDPNNPLVSGSDINAFCLLRCHDKSDSPYTNTDAPEVKGHTSVTTNSQRDEWTKVCTDCHEPHNQGQKYWKNANASDLFLAFGQIIGDGYSCDDGGTDCQDKLDASEDLVNPITTFTYSDGSFKSGWSAADMAEKTSAQRGTILLPNLKKTGWTFPVIDMLANTYDDGGTITIRGYVGVDNVYKYVSSPTPFGIILGQYVRQYIDINKDGVYETPIKLLDQDGSYSFANGNGTGLCEVCHTQTKHFQNDGVSGSDPDHANVGGAVDANCTTLCHQHIYGFGHFSHANERCIECHGHDAGVEYSPGLFSAGNGSSTSHSAHTEHDGDDVSGPDLECNACHDINEFPYFASGTDVNADGRYTLAETDACDSCHQDGTAVATSTPVLVPPPVWDTDITCAGCHDNGPAYASGSPKANSHPVHAAYTCDKCHYPTTTNGTSITDITKHLNGVYNVEAGVGVTFTYAYDAGGSTCSSISCHNNTNATWGSTACLNCHAVSQVNRTAVGPQFTDSPSHHIQGVDATDAHCYQCHWEANNNGTINFTYHGGPADSGSEIDLVIYADSTRPTTYAGNVLQYTADGSRGQIAALNTHCLGCHDNDTKGVNIFSDGKYPNYYAWDETTPDARDGSSVKARYSQSGTTAWGKYDYVNTKSRQTKAYSAHGNASANQRGWTSTESDVWSSRAVAPGTIGPGGGLVFDGADYIYATRGNATASFYRYTISTNTWSDAAVADLPVILADGSSLVYGGGDYIYATRGSTRSFYRYSISGNSWSDPLVADLPGAAPLISLGSDMAYDGGDQIFLTLGNGSNQFYCYSISGNSWTAKQALPATLILGSDMEYAGGFIYVTRGNDSTLFYRYSISGNSWQAMTPVPGLIGRDSNLVYTGDLYIYVASGQPSDTKFYKYTINTDSWTTMASSPDKMTYGADMVYGGNNFIYATRGVWSIPFYRYAIETWTDTSGTTAVACFDCHNAHGSKAGCVDGGPCPPAAPEDAKPTTSYTAGSGTVTGGILKDTTATKGGYAITYLPVAGGSMAEKNIYNPGADLCFDCHMKNDGSTPWSYQTTYGASQKIMGYFDTVNFGPGTYGSGQKFSYKTNVGHQGGHFWASTRTDADTSGLVTSPEFQINGLCTPCHDPHGVSTTLNKQYAVPLLKGTWVTSPYKEDAAPASTGSEIRGLEGSVGSSSISNPGYHIDQNTFANYSFGSTNAVTQSASEFGGLCLKCHLQAEINPNTDNTWKTMDRIHNTVKGWDVVGGTSVSTQHRFTCSKCHTPHDSYLPRLMVTNCLDYKHRGRVVSGGTSGSGPGNGSSNGDCGGGAGAGNGKFPAGGSGIGSGSFDGFSGSYGFGSQTCHTAGAPINELWNVKTPW